MSNKKLGEIQTEIEIIRPLFRQHRIEDILDNVNDYINIWEHNERPYKYQNIDYLKNDEYIKGKSELYLHYFGNYFTQSQKNFLMTSFISYFDKYFSNNSLTNVNAKTEKKTINYKNKILFNKKMNCYALVSTKIMLSSDNYISARYCDRCCNVYTMKVYFFKEYYGYKTLYRNYLEHYKKIYDLDKNECFMHRFCLKEEYYFRKDHTPIDTTEFPFILNNRFHIY
jgi:hypothetical protein